MCGENAMIDSHTLQLPMRPQQIETAIADMPMHQQIVMIGRLPDSGNNGRRRHAGQFGLAIHRLADFSISLQERSAHQSTLARQILRGWRLTAPGRENSMRGNARSYLA